MLASAGGNWPVASADVGIPSPAMTDAGVTRAHYGDVVVLAFTD